MESSVQDLNTTAPDDQTEPLNTTDEGGGSFESVEDSSLLEDGESDEDGEITEGSGAIPGFPNGLPALDRENSNSESEEDTTESATVTAKGSPSSGGADTTGSSSSASDMSSFLEDEEAKAHKDTSTLLSDPGENNTVPDPEEVVLENGEGFKGDVEIMKDAESEGEGEEGKEEEEEYEIVDEDDGDDEEGEAKAGELYNDSDDSEPEVSSEEEMDEDELNEIDDLLEQGLPESQRVPKRKQKLEEQSKEYNEKEIVVLEEKGKNTFEVLPGGWIEVRHCSGMPLYLHRKTRICTLGKPYFLGPGSVRRHSIPLSAIPCLAYRRALEAEKLQASQVGEESTENNQTVGESDLRNSKEPATEDPSQVQITTNQVDKPSECPFKAKDATNRKRKSVEERSDGQKKAKLDESILINGKTPLPTIISNPEDPVTVLQPDTPHIPGMLPLAKVATAKENSAMYSITPTELRDYCATLFNFKSVKCKKFKTWSARRKHTKDQKRLQLQRPSLPEGVKLISFPVHNGGGTAGENGKGSKEYVMNPQGKSSVCILHEYVQHALRKQPSYIFRELENAATPYAATVVINNMQYGTGYGSSKKQAKADAAKATLEILIPQMKEQLDGKKGDSEFDFIAFFEPFGLMDVAITKWCQNFSEPPPYALLLTCLQRNFGQGMSSNVKFEMISTGNQSNKFKMQVGEHSVEVTAANKRDGKQLASQSLLSKLHPNVNNFGAFIKLYGNSSIKSVKEKKQEEQQITTLQSKASANSPNWAILSKLKEEMQKLVNVQKLNDLLSPATAAQETSKSPK